MYTLFLYCSMATLAGDPRSNTSTGDAHEQSMDLASAKEIILRSAKEDPAVVDALCYISTSEKLHEVFFLRRLNRDFFNRLLYLGHFFKRKVHVQCDSTSCTDCSKNRQGLLNVLRLLRKLLTEPFSCYRNRSGHNENADEIEKAVALANTCLWFKDPQIIRASQLLIERQI